MPTQLTVKRHEKARKFPLSAKWGNKNEAMSVVPVFCPECSQRMADVGAERGEAVVFCDSCKLAFLVRMRPGKRVIASTSLRRIQADYEEVRDAMFPHL